MLLCNHLTIGYGTEVIQRDLTFSLRNGEMVCMLGRNGCGKSTLLRTLAGLQPPLDGTFQLGNGNDQSREVALVLSSDEAIERTTVHDVVAMGRYPYTSLLGKLTPYDEQVIEEALAAVGLIYPTAQPTTGDAGVSPAVMEVRSPGRTTDSTGDAGVSPAVNCPTPEFPPALYNSPFMAHSDGEKQRILIAKALAQQTPIILLDEPTAHLDLPNRIRVLQLLRSLAHNEGKTILISTHELDLAVRLSDRILLMSPPKPTTGDAGSLPRPASFIPTCRDGEGVGGGEATGDAGVSPAVMKPRQVGTYPDTQHSTLNSPHSTQTIQLATPQELIAADAFTQAFGLNPFDLFR